ncbi:glycosyltransferase [Kineococcus indalonis]|uniref:glycosyltransferase n=1 Tax=Kineococcus indalonis TaxID=2696566 RepID=UPI00196A44B7|nr:glycosyltransferase [Kineococcus indalonis]
MSSLPAFGHVYPVMPTAEALRAAGHDVVVATGGAPADRLAAAGWKVERVDAVIEAAVGRVMRERPELRTLEPRERWRVAAAMFGEVLAGEVDEQLTPLLRSTRPDLVVYEELAMGAAVAAARAGVPAVRHGVGPWSPPPMEAACAGALTELGRRGEDGELVPEGPGVFGRLHLDVWPASLGRPGARLPIPASPLRPQAWSEDGQPVPGWLEGPRARPVVYLTLGTVASGEAPVLREVLAGLSGLDVDVLAAVGSALDPGELGPLDPRVHVEAFVPAARVFPLVDVVVHHGGSGTLLGASAEGLPQLALPQRAHDQFPNAAALRTQGCGLDLQPEEVTAPAVHEAVRRLVQDASHREAGRRLAEEIAALPAPSHVVGVLEDLAA